MNQTWTLLFIFVLFIAFCTGCDDSAGSTNTPPSQAIPSDTTGGLVTPEDTTVQSRGADPAQQGSTEEQPSATGTPVSDKSPQQTRPLSQTGKKFPYNLLEPNAKYKLKEELKEISALSHIGDGKLACLQDEKGKIYIFDEKEKKIVEDRKFEKKGDFEGLEIRGNIAYALRSDGRLYEVINYLDEDPIVNKFKTGLATKNDTEGLGFDPVTGHLLIACKSSPNFENSSEHSGNRAIYAFDIQNQNLIRKPYLLINLDTLHAHSLKRGAITEFSAEIISTFKGDITFQPSAVAVHPISQEIYIIASVGKLLLVADRSGNLISFQHLKKSVFKHPEGITFAKNGDMYVSNEGDNGKSNILRFNYQNQ